MRYFAALLRPSLVTVSVEAGANYETMRSPGARDDARPSSVVPEASLPTVADALTDTEREALGARLYPLVELARPDLADKLTGPRPPSGASLDRWSPPRRRRDAAARPKRRRRVRHPAGMFLETGKAELEKMLESPAALDAKIDEAVAALEAAPAVDARRGDRLVATVAFSSRDARDAVVELGDLAGPVDAEGRCDRWALHRGRGEALPAGADEFKARAERAARRRGADARHQVWVGNVSAVGAKRVLPFLAKELCAVTNVEAVDDRVSKVLFLKAAGATCVKHQAQHLLFSSSSRLLAFEVLAGKRLRDAAGESGPAPNELYVKWATSSADAEETAERLATLEEYARGYATAARLHASVPKGVQPEHAFLSFASAVARDAVLGLTELDVDGAILPVRPVATPRAATSPPRRPSDRFDPARLARQNALAEMQPQSPRKLPYTYVIAEPDSPCAPLPTMARSQNFVDTWFRRQRSMSDASETASIASRHSSIGSGATRRMSDGHRAAAAARAAARGLSPRTCSEDGPLRGDRAGKLWSRLGVRL